MDVVYGAANTWAVTPWGTRVWVSLGSHWRADDPIVVAGQGLFTADPTVGMSYSIPPKPEQRVFVGPQPEASVNIEQATAAPGELRNTDRAFVEMVALRQQAHELGIAVDNRWGAGRLKQEIQNKLLGDDA